MTGFDSFDRMAAKSTAPPLSDLQQGEPIKTAEQRRAEWQKERHGLFTASEIHKLMTNERQIDTLPKGAFTYIRKKAAERLTDFFPDNYVSHEMQWGIEVEPQAVDAFVAKTGLSVSQSKDHQKFISAGFFGGTPDGLIEAEFSGLEIKCPNSATHLVYRQILTPEQLKAEAPDYYWQIICLMMITKSRHWYFVSYDPRFIRADMRLHIATIRADIGEFSKLRRRLELAREMMAKIIVGHGGGQQ